jgi:prevent-host-death family protein
MYNMNASINLSEARKRLPELADNAYAGHVYSISRRGRELAVLISVDEYKRLKAIEAGERNKDFEALLAPPPSDAISEEAASELAVEIVREVRAQYKPARE